jgi:lysophospholipid acyltransferase (LPLAT)-like uncharacterized protein
VRYRYEPLGDNYDPARPDLPGRFIYVFWHEYLTLPAVHYGRPDVQVLISTHADGQLITEIIQRFGFRVIRGSSTRGGVEAVRQLVKTGQHTHLALTPDGPRGPRRVVQPGVVYLAARTGLPIVPLGLAYERPWRANSWDRFALPRPFSRSRAVTGPAIRVPADLERDGWEAYRAQVEAALHHATQVAEARLRLAS